MRTFHLHATALVPHSLDEVFAFFARAENLQALTPPSLDFRIVTPLPIVMTVGTRIDYRLRLHGVGFSWRSVISEWQPPFAFCDEQERGPYRLWRHRHEFAATPEGTLVTDAVEYAVPGGWLAHTLVVRRNLATIFTWRHRQMAALLGAHDATLEV